MDYSKSKIKRFLQNTYPIIVDTIKPMGMGTSNDVFEVKADNKYIFILIDEELSEEKEKQLSRQFSLLNYLDSEGFPYDTPAPIQTNKGENYTTWKNRYCWLYEKIPGTIKEEKIRENVCSLGKALSIYHEHVKGFRDIDTYSFEQLESIKEELNTQKKDGSEIEDVFSFFIQEVSELESMNFGVRFEEVGDVIVTHGDFTLQNVIFDDDKITGIIDFDNIRVNPKIGDISWSIMGTCFDGNSFNSERATTFLKEYLKSQDLSNEEKSLLKPSIKLDLIFLFKFMYKQEYEDPKDRDSLLGWKRKIKSLETKWPTSF